MRSLGLSSPLGVISGALAPLLIFSAGCRANGPPAECSGEPAFVVTVTAQGGKLPADLELEVRYGGSQAPETYQRRSPHRPEVVFCSLDAEAGGAGGAGSDSAAGAPGAGGEVSESLACRLWTEGPASVVARGGGYPPVLLDLRVDSELCTVVESIELIRGDGG